MKKKKFVTDESKLVSTYFGRPHRNWKTGTAEEFLDDCEECEGVCKEFRTCKKCGGDMTYGANIANIYSVGGSYVGRWKCQDCQRCEVE